MEPNNPAGLQRKNRAGNTIALAANDLEALVQRTHDLNERIIALSDRLLGARVAEVRDDGEQTGVADGDVNRLTASINQLRFALNECHDMIEQLEQL